jgi:hypothetical protein
MKLDPTVYPKLMANPARINEMLSPKKALKARQEKLVKNLSTNEHMQACGFLTQQERCVMINDAFPTMNLKPRRLAEIYHKMGIKKK